VLDLFVAVGHLGTGELEDRLGCRLGGGNELETAELGPVPMELIDATVKV
jgi:hypothetical protein